MSNREKIIGVIMVGVIIYWSMTVFSGDTRKKRRGSAVPLSLVPETAVAETKEKILSVDLDAVLDRIAYESGERIVLEKDPFLMITRGEDARPKDEISDLKLTGIMWEDKNPMAMINDRILKEGDMILNFKIQRITQNDVTLFKGAETYILKLFSNIQTGEDIDQ